MATDVTLRELGPKKINVIKLIRETTHCGLKEAKDLAEQDLPAVIATGLLPGEAHLMVMELRDLGANAWYEGSQDDNLVEDLTCIITALKREIRDLKTASPSTEALGRERDYYRSLYEARDRAEDGLRKEIRELECSLSEANSKIWELKDKLSEQDADLLHANTRIEQLIDMLDRALR